MVYVVIGTVAMVVGIMLVFQMSQTEDLAVGLLALALVVGGYASATAGLNRLASHELLYGGEKGREGKKEGGEG
jgi:fatty-acid desaturase